MVQELDSLTAYKTELQKPGVLVLDFYSPQCGPCVVVAPLFEKLSKQQYGEEVRFFKVNGLDPQGAEIQKTADVTWWPTFVIYRNGQEQWRAKVPNPPQEHPVAELIRGLEDITVKN